MPAVVSWQVQKKSLTAVVSQQLSCYTDTHTHTVSDAAERGTEEPGRLPSSNDQIPQRDMSQSPLQIDSLLAKTSEIYFKRDLAGVQAAQLTSLLTIRRGAALWDGAKPLIYNLTLIEFSAFCRGLNHLDWFARNLLAHTNFENRIVLFHWNAQKIILTNVHFTRKWSWIHLRKLAKTLI